MKMKRLSSQKGITLLELVLCLAMLGILAYIASPILGNSTSALSLDAAAKQVEADLRYAQNMATTTSDTYRWESKTSAGADSATDYRVVNDDTGTTATSPYNHQAMNTNLSNSYPNTQFDSNNYVITFTGGSGAPTAPVSLVLTNTVTGTTKTVTISTSGNINVN